MNCEIQITDIKYDENFFENGNCATFVQLNKSNKLFFYILYYYLFIQEKILCSLNLNKNLIILNGKLTIDDILNLFKKYNICSDTTKNLIEQNKYRQKLIDSEEKFLYNQNDFIWFIHIGLSEENIINEINSLSKIKDKILSDLIDLDSLYSILDESISNKEKYFLDAEKLVKEKNRITYLIDYLKLKLQIFYDIELQI